MASTKQVAALVAAALLASTACSAAGPAGSRPSASQASTRTASATTAASPSTVAPTPSPTPIAILDGEPWIVYQWAQEHGQAIYLMRPDGSDAHEIAPEVTGEAGGPDWSPDGKRIAFELMVSDDVFEIWTVNAAYAVSFPAHAGNAAPAPTSPARSPSTVRRSRTAARRFGSAWTPRPSGDAA